MTITCAAKDIMTRNVLTAYDDWTLQELARFLTDNGISGAPVITGEGKLVGVVSLTDVARATGRLGSGWFEPLSVYHHDGKLSIDELSSLKLESSETTNVRDIMTSVVFEVDAGASIGQVAETLLRGRIHRVFVVEHGKVVGVISALDLLRVLCD
jgi:CBS domain-containing protein